jgi:formylmethanofuran dehydrogenase subunit C
MVEIEASGESCLCDFTFDFYWQHQGSRLNPDKPVGDTGRTGGIGGKSYRQLVEALKNGETVRIKGDAGSRLGSSLGVDLIKLGGKGVPIPATGRIVVDGDVGSRMGISMLRGAIYVSGDVLPPLGNVIEVDSDMTGYRKYASITEALEGRLSVVAPNAIKEKELVISDGILRDTVGARNTSSRTIRLKGDAGMSTGILLQSGLVEISGSADRNTGVLMKGGRVVVKGSTGDFTGAEMKGGEIFVESSAGSYACAKMKGGAVYAREGKPLSPAKVQSISPAEQTAIAKALGLSPLYAMMYKKLSL